MADLDLSIGAVDRGARRLIAELVRALQGLKKVQQEALDSRTAREGSRALVESLRQQLELQRELVAQRERSLAKAKQVSAQEIADAKAASTAKTAALKQEAAERNRIAEESRAAGRQSVADAREAVRQEIAEQNRLLRAVRNGAAERVATEKRLRDVANASQRARVLDEKARLAEFRRQRDAQRREISLEIERRKRLRDVEQAKLDRGGPIRGERGQFISRADQRAIVRAQQEQIINLRRQRAESAESHRERITQQKDLLQSERDQAEAIKKIRSGLVKDAVEKGKQEIAAQKQTGAQAIQAARDKLAAAQRESVIRQQAVIDARRKGREEVAAARVSGTAEVAAARAKAKANVESAASTLRSSRQRVTALQREATEAEKAARRQERAINRVSIAYRRHGSDLPHILQVYRRLRLAVAALVSAYSGFRILESFVRRGLAFNELVESAKLGIAALITAQADLIDQNGQLLQGTQALGAAQSIAATQLNKLRVAGIQTVATTEELITAFQETVGAGLNVGLTLDQIRKFSVLVAQAGAAIHLPMNQLQQESRSILASTIDRNSRIAKTLNLTNAMINQAKQENRLFELLNEKFKAFNIAGIESVKTWQALKSTIADAFSVFAGVSVEPLFESLRKAGFEAINRIFDFDTARVRDSFQGLIEGLQSVFQQVGFVFSSVIRRAVDRAEDLSQWIRDNRREMEKTAVAIGSMVEAFLDMIGAIAKGITELVSFGNEVNTVVGAARVLEAVFRAIGENIKLIIGLITARALITGILNLAGLFKLISRVGVAGAGRAGAARLIPGVGTLITTVIALAAAYDLLSDSTEDAGLEMTRLGTEMDSQRRRMLDLIGQWNEYSQQLEETGLKQEDQIRLQQRLKDIAEDLTAIDKNFAGVLDEGNGSLKDRRAALLRLIEAQLQVARANEQAIRARRAELTEGARDLQAMIRQKRDPRALDNVLTPEAEKRVKQTLENVNTELEQNGAELDRATSKVEAYERAWKELSPAPIVRPRTLQDQEAALTAAAERRIKQAETEFERAKAQLDADRAKFDALLAERKISAEEHIRALAEIEQREIDAEFQLLEAKEDEAIRKRDAAQLAVDAAAKKGTAQQKAAANERLKAAQDEVDSFEALYLALGFKRRKIDADTNAALAESAEDRAKRVLEIEQRYLEATGRLFEAATLEIQRKNEQGIRQAVQDFGSRELRLRVAQVPAGDLAGLRQALREFQGEIDKNPIIAKLVFTVDAEARQEQLEAIKAEIDRIQDAVTSEVQSIQADFKRRGKLTADQEQQRSDQIAAANARAIDQTMALRHQLELLLATAATPQEVLLIKDLLAQLDAIQTRAEQVNLEMQRLVQGAREAFESGFAQFFQAIGSGAEESKNAFRNMVKSIIDDLRRLAAELLARQVVSAFLSLLTSGAGSAASRGTLAQSQGQADGGLIQGMAGGGPARPAHGILRGGVYGKDSIPILAQADEYFVKRQATRYYGSDFMDLINQMRIPVTWARELFGLVRTHFTPRPLRPRHSFAQGGVVGRGTGARPIQRQEVHHIIGLDQNGALTFLTGPTGKAIVLNHVGNSPNFVNRLGRVSKNGRR